MNALDSGGRTAWICFRAWAIKFVIIETPFPNIPGHVFNSERTRAERKRADRRTFGITIVDLAIAPRENGILVGEVREVAAAVVISPRIFALIVSFSGIFPFRFGRQPVFATFASA